MLNRFTNVTRDWAIGRATGGILLTLVLGACSSLPTPFAGGDDNDRPADAERSEITREQTRDERLTDAGTGPGIAADAPVTPPPEVNNGNDRLFARALEMLSAGQTESAEVLLLEITQDQPELAGPWVNLGLISAHRGDTDAAIGAMSRALKANPHNCDALNWLGINARKAGRFDEAEAHYKLCLARQPGFMAANLNLGILYELYMGRFSEALAAYQDYQLARAEVDPQVNGWMLDLERRVAVAQR